MNIRDILLLYEYNYWATRQILAASAQVSPERFLNPLRETLMHTLDSERAWRMLCQDNTLAGFRDLQEEAFPNVAVLTQRWLEEERAMRDYLAQLADDDLDGYVRYTTPEGERRERVLWHCLVHIVNHGTQHRSEAAVILTDYGHSPGGLDMTMFLNQYQA